MELPKGMALYKVSYYEFVRVLSADDVTTIQIRIKTPVSGKRGKFLAVPEKESSGGPIHAKEKYVGEGNSEAEALESCLANIRDARLSDIFPKKTKR